MISWCLRVVNGSAGLVMVEEEDTWSAVLTRCSMGQSWDSQHTLR